MNNEMSTAIPDSLAVIDVGSNSVRAFSAEYLGDGIFEIVADEMIQPRLGARIDQTGEMEPEAIDRVADFVERFLADYGPFEQVRCPGTAAAREANNTDTLRRKLSAAGAQLQVISPEREAELTHRGALLEIGPKSAGHRTCVVDVGGNSTEISTLSGDRLRVASIPLGAVRLTHKCLRSDPITPEDLVEAQRIAAEAMQEHQSLLHASDTRIGAGGTAVSIGLLCDRWKVSTEDLRQLTGGLAAIPIQQRRQLLSFDPDRAEVVVGGLVMFLQVVHISPSKYIYISVGGLREGVLVEAGATEIRRSCGGVESRE